MAITDSAVQIQFAGANTYALAAAGAINSDAITKNAGETKCVLTVKGSHGGTPASGDTVDVILVSTSGDPDADPDVANEFSTAAHSKKIGLLDTYADNSAVQVVEFSLLGILEYKIRFVSNAAATITVSAGGNRVVVA